MDYLTGHSAACSARVTTQKPAKALYGVEIMSEQTPHELLEAVRWLRCERLAPGTYIVRIEIRPVKRPRARKAMRKT